MKTVLITGANKSIGFEVARQLAQQNYHVYLGSRDLLKGKEAVAKLQEEGLMNTEAVEIDITNSLSISAAKDLLEQKAGKLDVLVNNAGISGGFPQPPTTISIETIREVFETNFFGTVAVTYAFLDLLKRSASPRIVNVSSGLASLTLHNDPEWRFYKSKTGAYGPSKTALNAFTIALAYEFINTPFRINAVDPGFTATDFNGFRGTSDVATAASHIVKYAMLDQNGPTGKYISFDNNPATGESPW